VIKSGSTESPKVTTLDEDGHGPGAWNQTFDKIADIPWGVLGLIALIVLAVTHQVDADELRVFATAAGLLGVGHGIHTGAKNLARRPNR
jgi:hypothetical protein